MMIKRGDLIVMVSFCSFGTFIDIAVDVFDVHEGDACIDAHDFTWSYDCRVVLGSLGTCCIEDACKIIQRCDTVDSNGKDTHTAPKEASSQR